MYNSGLYISFATKRGFGIIVDNFAENHQLSVILPLCGSWTCFGLEERMLLVGCVTTAVFGLRVYPERPRRRGGGGVMSQAGKHRARTCRELGGTAETT